jgi:hypothetical protein
MKGNSTDTDTPTPTTERKLEHLGSLGKLLDGLPTPPTHTLNVEVVRAENIRTSSWRTPSKNNLCKI